MIEFLKNLLKSVDFKSKNEEVNKYNKIIYSIIIFCALVFVIIILYFVIKSLPGFIQVIRDGFENSKVYLNK